MFPKRFGYATLFGSAAVTFLDIHHKEDIKSPPITTSTRVCILSHQPVH